MKFQVRNYHLEIWISKDIQWAGLKWYIVLTKPGQRILPLLDKGKGLTSLKRDILIKTINLKKVPEHLSNNTCLIPFEGA